MCKMTTRETTQEITHNKVEGKPWNPKKINFFVQLEIMISLPMKIIRFSRNLEEEKIQFL